MSLAEHKIYHIVNVENLPSIIKDAWIFSDSKMKKNNKDYTNIGMSNIKQRRLNRIVECHPDSYVGDYVPFNFCFRSVMLFVINRNNHNDLPYKGGQVAIVHLEANLLKTVEWAHSNNQRWAFTNSNASAAYTEMYSDLNKLTELNWDAIHAYDFKSVKEEKQAEFLLEGQFPWHLVERIGVHSSMIYNQLIEILIPISHKPIVEIKSNWYY